MPKLSVWLIKASLLHMGIGFLFGAAILHHKGIPIYDWTWNLLGPHVEVMIFGWTMQFVLGMAFWILPRFSSEPRYGRASVGWWGFGLLNAGIVLVVIGAWFVQPVISLAGQIGVLAAVVLFVILLYPRVKPLGGYAASLRS